MSSPLGHFQPLKTHHCITGSMRNVYEYHGVSISEDMLLGLGAGVGFVYWHQTGTTPFMGGRANVGRPGEEGLERTAGRRTGVHIEQHTTGSARKAETDLLRLLDAGEPVMCGVDMGFLPYLNLPEGYHFGGHAVVVAGYDPARREVQIADRDGVLHPVSFEALAAARGSDFKPFPPRHAWFSFDFTQARPPLPGEVWDAVRGMSDAMLNPPITNLGAKGIRTAGQRIVKWPSLLDDAALRGTCFNAWIFIDATGGTGGGLFRYMFGRFLVEAAAITGEAALVDSGEAFRVIGDKWQVAAAQFKAAAEAPDPAALLPEIAVQLEALSRQETDAWQRLREVTPEAVLA